MRVGKTIAALLGATATIHTAAQAQTGQDSAAAEETAPATPEEMASRIEFLQAQVEAMQAQLEALKKTSAQSAPNWKGAPEFAGEGGWRFKLRGRLQYDVGYVGNPNDAIPTKNLGFNSRARRLLLGAEGDMPGGFKYKAEFDFAPGSNQVNFEDVILQYAPSGKPFSVTLGYFYPFSSLEVMTSSAQTSFLERAQMNDAFGHNRRIGAALGYVTGDGRFRINAGLFNDVIENSFDNDGWIGAVRAVYSPTVGKAQLHVGVNYQHREFQSNAQNATYQARPFVQTTDQRFVSTGAIAAQGDDVYGIELAGILGPLHVAGEAQWLKVDGYRPGTSLSGGDSVGTSVFYAGHPSFFSGYAEVGYWLTGETRGYKNGAFDRTKVLHPFDKGGWGAFQVNARYDYLDLSDRVAGTGFAAPNFVNGGKQTGYLLSLIWQPIDYVRFTAQYARTEVKGGPRAAIVEPTSADPAPERDFGADIFAIRAQLDF